MLTLLCLIPALPFAGFIVLALAGRRMPRNAVAVIGCGTVGLSASIAIAIAARFLTAPPEGDRFIQTLWTWLAAGGISIRVAFALDPLSLLMVLVITVVGFLIHIYSTEFMQHDEGYSRFFAYLNLFVGAMLTLVLADNLLLLYLGWEGVGLCSYLLIGFWYGDPANGRAARKAFITTRAGDTALIIGLFLLFTNLNTLTISEIIELAPARFPAGSSLAVAAAALLLGGAVGKSAQLPLQVWLPDAMAGPTPVSALIHAATMVTAGVYLVARMNALFALAPAVQFAVAVIGAATLLLAGCSALVQSDLKRVLAYSTISQIGYMFLALGVGAWSAALFHFLTHAFFKALLFLGAGIVIKAVSDEHDMHKMGGLRKELPLTFWTFLIGSASLAALPFVTAGFYSKDLILTDVWASPAGGWVLWCAGAAGAFITAVYTSRMLFLVFFGPAYAAVSERPGKRMEVPLIILAALSTIAGFVEIPPFMGSFRPFSAFLGSVLPPLPASHEGAGAELVLLCVTEALLAAGIALSYVLFLRKRPRGEATGTIGSFWFSGWGFDWLYEKLFVSPLVWFSRVNRRDAVDDVYTGIAQLNLWMHRQLALTQTGSIRWYAAGIALGAVIILGIVILS